MHLVAKTMKRQEMAKSEKIALLQVVLNSASPEEVGGLVVKNSMLETIVSWLKILRDEVVATKGKEEQFKAQLVELRKFYSLVLDLLEATPITGKLITETKIGRAVNRFIKDELFMGELLFQRTNELVNKWKAIANKDKPRK